MFSDLQIRSKLVAMLVLPLVGLILFASWQVWDSAQTRAAADRLNRATELATSVTQLIDTIQEERALSSGYVAAQSDSLPGPRQQQLRSNYQPSMLETRAQVDEVIASTRGTLEDFDISGLSERMQSDVATATRLLDNVDIIRGEIDSGRPPRSRVLTVYSELATGLQNVVSAVAQEPGADQLGDRTAALAQLSSAKEAAAESQAVLLAAIVSGEYSSSDFQRFSGLAGEEAAELDQFLASAGPAQQAIYRSTVASGNATTITQLFQASGLSGPDSISGLDDQLWLNRSGERLSSMGALEQRLADDVAAAAAGVRSDAIRSATIASVAAIVLAALTVLVSGLLARSMANPITALERSAREVAERRLPEVVQRLQSPEADEEDLASLTDSARIPVQSRDEIGRLAVAFHSVQQVAVRTAAEQAALRRSINDMFVNLARRNQTLIDRQLNMIEDLEHDTEDPGEMAKLFSLDHLATRMRRNQENLLVLARAEPARRWSDPIALAHLLRAASAEVEDYTRVELLTSDDAPVIGYATSDIVHLLAELIENSTMFSPPHTPVRIASQAAANGYLIEIEDQGTGMSDDDLLEANERLAEPPEIDFALSRRLGFFVVGRLAQRHGIRVQLRHSWYGGVTALVLLPERLFQGDPAAMPAARMAGVLGGGGGPLGGRPELQPPAAATAGAHFGGSGRDGNGGGRGRVFDRGDAGQGFDGWGDRAPQPNGGYAPNGGQRPPVPADRPAFTPRNTGKGRFPRTAPNGGQRPRAPVPPPPQGRGPERARDGYPRGDAGDPLAEYRTGLVQGRIAANLDAPPPLSSPISQFRREEDSS